MTTLHVRSIGPSRIQGRGWGVTSILVGPRCFWFASGSFLCFSAHLEIVWEGRQVLCQCAWENIFWCFWLEQKWYARIKLENHVEQARLWGVSLRRAIRYHQRTPFFLEMLARWETLTEMGVIWMALKTSNFLYSCTRVCPCFWEGAVCFRCSLGLSSWWKNFARSGYETRSPRQHVCAQSWWWDIFNMMNSMMNHACPQTSIFSHGTNCRHWRTQKYNTLMFFDVQVWCKEDLLVSWEIELRLRKVFTRRFEWEVFLWHNWVTVAFLVAVPRSGSSIIENCSHVFYVFALGFDFQLSFGVAVGEWLLA